MKFLTHWIPLYKICFNNLGQL